MSLLLAVVLTSAAFLLSNVAAFTVPHFTGARGTPFDFHGKPGNSYCLVTDRRVHVNALMGGYRSPKSMVLRSWIKGLGILWADENGYGHYLYVLARSSKSMLRNEGFISVTSLDGQDVALPTKPGYSLVRGDLIVTYVGTTQSGPFSMEKYRLRVAGLLDLSVTLRAAQPAFQTTIDAQAHFNLVINSISASDVIHGVTGQTYRPDTVDVAEEIMDGAPENYVTTGVLAPDCSVSQFGQQ